MSQYRSDRDAARQRIADLEAQLAEREAALFEQDVAVAERDAEIARLRHQLVLAGILRHRVRPVHTAWASRLLVLTFAVAGAALAVGVLAVRGPRPVVVEVVPASTQEPFFADPAPLALRAPMPAVEEPQPEPAAVDVSLRRELEAKMWRGRASMEEVRLLAAICKRQGDPVCHARALEWLDRRKPRVF
ncbi:Hypothetical protein A7982_04773 [Minicystis rosea]|nr:Hypothetical protein A7982_04773 [Minicystis rosea]